MGFALGVYGLSFHDFCLLTPYEFQEVMKARSEADERSSRDMWECMRILAAVSVSPFSKGRVQPQSIIKLPWVAHRNDRTPTVSKEEDVKRLTALLSKIRH